MNKNNLEVSLQNIKCDGCVNTIKEAKLKHSNINGVEVLKETGVVKLTGQDLNEKELLKELADLGYPEQSPKGFLNKLSSLLKK